MADIPNQAAVAARGSWSERIALSVGATLNDTASGRAVQNVFLRGVGYSWMRAILSRHMLIEGVEGFRELRPDRGVLLVCNHRSFFDFYALSVAFFAAGTPWIQRLQFPVRSNFFYERPLGVLANLAAGAAVMYPPFYRSRDKLHRNRHSLEIVTATLERAGSVVGFHPEGTRNKGDDPYALAPMQPGAGEIALKANPIVIPCFINGLGNSLGLEIRRRFDAAAAYDPCICVFGRPLDLGDLMREPSRPATQKQAADRMGVAILQLAARERELRAMASARRIASDDARWLRNQPASRFFATRIA